MAKKEGALAVEGCFVLWLADRAPPTRVALQAPPVDPEQTFGAWLDQIQGGLEAQALALGGTPGTVAVPGSSLAPRLYATVTPRPRFQPQHFTVDSHGLWVIDRDPHAPPIGGTFGGLGFGRLSGPNPTIAALRSSPAADMLVLMEEATRPPTFFYKTFVRECALYHHMDRSMDAMTMFKFHYPEGRQLVLERVTGCEALPPTHPFRQELQNAVVEQMAVVAGRRPEDKILQLTVSTREHSPQTCYLPKSELLQPYLFAHGVPPTSIKAAQALICPRRAYKQPYERSLSHGGVLREAR